jgi:predicted solute-binding protein
MTSRIEYADQLEDTYLRRAPEHNQELIAQAISIYVSNRKIDKDEIRIMVRKLWYPDVAGGNREVMKVYEDFVAKYKK